MRRDGKVGRHSDPMLLGSKGVFIDDDNWLNVGDGEFSVEPSTMSWEESDCLQESLQMRRASNNSEEGDVSGNDCMDES